MNSVFTGNRNRVPAGFSGFPASFRLLGVNTLPVALHPGEITSAGLLASPSRVQSPVAEEDIMGDYPVLIPASLEMLEAENV